MMDQPSDSQSRLRRFTDHFALAIVRRITTPAWLVRASAIGLCVSSLAFVGLFIGGFAIGGGQLAIVSQPLPLRLALWLPPFLVAFAVVTIVGTVVAWYNEYWSLAGRIHQTILAVLGLIFVWQLFASGFLPSG